MTYVNSLRPVRENPYKAVVELNGQPFRMEIDTGASVSLISQTTKRTIFPPLSDRDELTYIHCGAHPSVGKYESESDVQGLYGVT